MPADVGAAKPMVTDAPADRIRGGGWLARADRAFARIDGLVDRWLPESLNPLARTGAIANTCLLVAVISGILLLFWYSPSVRGAYDSLEAMREGSPLGQFVRSLHRYSSDACMLFILLHVVRVFVAMKFTGARSLAWVSGFVLLGVIWLIGWTGYWLVWDERAQQVALGTVRFFSLLPFLGDPLARSFLTNETVPSLLFFLVFFTHMLLPLAVAFLLWLHLSRVTRPKLLTGRVLTFWILATLSVMSLLIPAESAGRADLATRPEGFEMDWWYLWPLVLTDRLGGGMLWALFFTGVVALCGVPWWLAKKPVRRPAARVDEEACQGCTLCSKDCPFDAISMVGRGESGQGPRLMAVVDPDRCVSCGICTGACDSDAIAVPGFSAVEEKKALREWIRERQETGEKAFLAYVCGQAGGADAERALAGYRVRSVPCAGWVGAPLIEEALEQGAGGVLIVGCGSGEKHYREGGDWLRDRLDAVRKPRLRRPGAREKVRYLQWHAGDNKALAAEALRFRNGWPAGSRGRSGRIKAVACGVFLATVLGAVTWFGSEAPYAVPAGKPELLVSFHHGGERLPADRAVAEEQQSGRAVHMRAGPEVAGPRAPVRLRLTVDGEVLLDREFEPRGLRHDGPSTALERLTLNPGERIIHARLNDSPEEGVWTHEWRETLTIDSRDRRVLLFQGDSGFTLH